MIQLKENNGIPRSLLLTMAVIAGLTVANCYYNQPLLEMIRHDLGISQHSANLITVATQIGYALGLCFLIPMGDLYSRRRIIVTNMTVAAIMAIIIALAHNVWLLWGASLFLGACSVIPQFFIPIAGQYSAPKNKSRNMGIVLSGLLTGILASRVISGYVGDWLGWREMFLIAAVVMLICMALTLKIIPEMKRNYIGSYKGLMITVFEIFAYHPRIRLYSIRAAFGFGSMMAIWSCLAFHLAQAPFFSGSEMVGTLGACGIAGAIAASGIGKLVRLVTRDIGGSDAITYIGYFEKCISGAKVFPYSDHMDFLMGVIIKAIRFCTSSHYVFFLIVYGFMAWSYFYFCYRFAPKKTSSIAYFLLFFLFLRSFNTLRSNFGISFILLGLVALQSLKNYKVYLITFSSVLIHKAGLIFAMVLPFVQIFKKKKLTVPIIIIFIAISSIVATFLQSFFLTNFADVDLGGAYQSYAGSSLEGGGFLDKAWKIAFEQIALGVMMLINIKRLRTRWSAFDEEDKKKIDIIYLICVFDFMLIPVNYIMGIWRGYEFLYAARLVMWGEVIAVSAKSNSILRCFYFMVFVAWLIFRMDRTYEDSCLMPYIFEPFLYI